MGETVQYETRKKDTQLEKKTRNTNKICETRIKGAKFDENVQNTNENMRNYETKQIFLFRETTRNTFFVFSYFFSFAKRSKLGETVIHKLRIQVFFLVTTPAIV